MKYTFCFVQFILLLSCQTNKYSNMSEAIQSKQLVSVIATIHGFHFKTDDYPIQILKSIIEDFKPELILVEIRPEAFLKGEYEDGPIEMTYITALAVEKGIKVQGIDWWREEDIGKLAQKLNPEEQKAYDLEIQKIGTESDLYKNFSFSLLNSSEFQNKVFRIKNINTKWQQDPTWATRQKHFHENTLAEIDKSKSKKTLVFVGTEHKAELDVFLSDISYITVLPSTEFTHLTKLKNSTPLDKSFQIQLQKSKSRIENKLSTKNDKKTQDYLSAKLNQIEFVLEKFF